MSEVSDESIENKIEEIEKKKMPLRVVSYAVIGALAVTGFAVTSAWVVSYIDDSRKYTEMNIESAKSQYMIEIDELRQSISKIKSKTDELTNYAALKEQVSEISRKQDSIIKKQSEISDSINLVKANNSDLEDKLKSFEVSYSENDSRIKSLENSMRLIAGDANKAKSIGESIDSKIEKAVSQFMKDGGVSKQNSPKINLTKTTLATKPVKLNTAKANRSKPPIVYAKYLSSINGFTLFSIDNWGGRMMATLQSSNGATKSIFEGDTFDGYTFTKVDKSNSSVSVAKDGRTWSLK
ncbi:hypothetical protein [Motilimonas eburnea]|uniref:hypothetical protein n=1 Tax=Motilimonas eburnea TaxID=1737488 RepID=UPI001E6599AF|nr:hypothetical protein [Motilimonas eburnea]MCE2573833.1 hypothetical protein [Motilimonas eburnea]